MKINHHAMVDIETLGTSNDAAIVSIACVIFDITTGETINQFYEKISIESCIKNNLKISSQTLKFWMEQNDNVRKELFVNDKELGLVLWGLKRFLDSNEFYGIWGNSARFDLGILENAYNSINVEKPWNHRIEKCLRTISSLFPQIKKDEQPVGDQHNALDDCFFQINYLVKTWKAIYDGK